MESGCTTQTVRLDPETILDAAETIVGEEGLASLTMRRIGTQLGTDPTAVYRHFRNKDELLAALANRMFDADPDVDPTLPWQDQVRVIVRHGFERYRAHPDLGILLARQHDDLPGLVRLRELKLSLLVHGAGLTLERAAMFSHVFENHVVGCGLFFAVCEHEADLRTSDPEALRRVYAALPEGEAPLARAAAPHLFGDQVEAFELGTELLIAAVEREGAAA